MSRKTETSRADSAAPVQSPPGFRGEFLTPAEASTVDALAERIWPAGRTPGARDAGVLHFIDHLLATHYAPQQTAFRKGLRNLIKHCRKRYGRDFCRLTPAEQDSFLARLEAGKIVDWPEAAQFFEMVRIHTIEGMLSDPKYRGNRDGVGWRGLL